MATFKYCPNCGEVLVNENGFYVCPKCGKRFEVKLKQLTEEEKEAKYQEALSLSKQHKYTQAVNSFKSIRDYKDVNTLIEENMVLAKKETYYQNAINCMNLNQFAQAVEYLNQIGDYRDSLEKKDYAEKYLKTYYDSGLTSYNKKRYGLAKKAFGKIKGYKDSSKYYSVCEKKVRTITIFASIIGLVIGFFIGFGVPKLVEYTSASSKNNTPTIQEIICENDSENIVIPAHVEYKGKEYDFSVIEHNSFENNNDIKTLTIENGVTEIEAFAFFGCENLKEIKIADSVVVVSPYAFEGCNITSYEGPAVGLKAINGSNMDRVVVTSGNVVSSSFSNITKVQYLEIKGTASIDHGTISCRAVTAKLSGNCVHILDERSLKELVITSDYYRVPNLSSFGNLEKIVIEEGVKQIDSYAFNNTKIKTIFIPSSVLEIGNSLFSNCDELEEIIVSSSNPNYDSRDNCNAIIRKQGNVLIATCKNTVIPDSVEVIGSDAFNGINTEEIFNIPTNIIRIEDYAFQNCKTLVEVNIPASITEISKYAFNGCKNLTKVTMTDSITNISEGAFSNCVALEDITLSENIMLISNGAFFNCVKLKEITIPSKVKTIGEYAFGDCTQLKTVNTSSKITRIGKSGFSNCQRLETFDFHVELYNDNEYCYIEDYAFYRCVKLDNIVIPRLSNNLGSFAFCECLSLRNLVFREGVKKIGEHAFDGCCKLVAVHLPQSLEEIETYAFYGNYNLEELYIDVNLKTIHGYAFTGCNSLKNVYYKGTTNQWDQIKIYNSNSELNYVTITYEYTSD